MGNVSRPTTASLHVRTPLVNLGTTCVRRRRAVHIGRAPGENSGDGSAPLNQRPGATARLHPADPAQPHASTPPTRPTRTPPPRRPGPTARLHPADPAQPHACLRPLVRASQDTARQGAADTG